MAEVRLPTDFPEPTGDDEINLVVVGESSAAGIPYCLYNLSMGSILTSTMSEAIPDKTFNVIQIAESGDTLEGQHEKLARLSRRPDLVLVYCGHNEFSARLPFGREVDHYADARVPTPWEAFVKRVERASPLFGLIRETADRCRVAIPPPAHGTRALVDVPAYSPAEFDALLADFRRRLEAIVTFAERAGAVCVLVAPPGNDFDFEPNRSVLPRETRRAGRAAFARDFAAARRAEASDPDEVLRRYRALLALAPGFAETHYRMARLLERSGQADEAYRHDVDARDLDGFPVRCPTAFQEAYRETAARHGCILIDGQSYFHTIGRRGLLDDHLFHDGMHPSLRGQAALSLAVLRALHARQAFGWARGSPEPNLAPDSLAKLYGLNPSSWSKLCHWGIMFYGSCAHARFDPTERRSKQGAFAKAAQRIDAGEAPESVGLPNIGVPAPNPPFTTPVHSTRDVTAD